MVRYLFYTIGDLTYQSPLVCHLAESETNVTQRYIPGGRRPQASVKLRVPLEPTRSGT